MSAQYIKRKEAYEVNNCTSTSTSNANVRRHALFGHFKELKKHTKKIPYKW